MSPLSERICDCNVPLSLVKEVEELEEDAANTSQLKKQLRKALERLAEVGLIDPTPHSIYLYMNGWREL